MKAFPVEQFEIQTTMSIEEILAILEAHVEPRWNLDKALTAWARMMLGNPPDYRQFEGTVSRDGFVISPIIGITIRDPSDKPRIVGVFRQTENGTLISMSISLRPFHKFWFLFLVSYGALMSGLFLIFNEGHLPIAMVGLFLLFMFMYGMLLFEFHHYTRESEQILVNLLSKNGTAVEGKRVKSKH